MEQNKNELSESKVIAKIKIQLKNRKLKLRKAPRQESRKINGK